MTMSDKTKQPLLSSLRSPLKTERISQHVLYVLVGVATVVFAAFYLIGFDMEQPDVPGFNAPLFTGMLIVLMWSFLGLALAVFAVSVWRGVRMHGKEGRNVNGIPAARISIIILSMTTALLVLTFGLAPTDSILINGQPYENTLGLRVAEMFITTSLVLIVIAVGAVLFGFTRYKRK